MWFCIPFTLATTMGLAALALDLPISLAEAGEGTPLVENNTAELASSVGKLVAVTWNLISRTVA